MTNPEIAPELVARMVALVRQMNEKGRNSIGLSMPLRDWTAEAYAEAIAIAAELPAPVDPDLVEARAIVALAQHPDFSPKNAADRYRKGDWDGDTAVKRAVAAIKAARTEQQA